MNAEYSAHHLQVLEGLEAVRKRPGMYIGSNGSPGLILPPGRSSTTPSTRRSPATARRSTSSCMPTAASRCTTEVAASRSMWGRAPGLTGVELVYTKLHAGGKFGGGSTAASGGLHGVGASMVNALSERLDVEVDRGGKTYAMSFHRGEPGIFADSGRSARTLLSHRSRRRANCG